MQHYLVDMTETESKPYRVSKIDRSKSIYQLYFPE
jgi:hypothetical protein